MYCEYCHKEHNGSYGSGRFCSISCSRKFSSNFVNRKEFKEMKCQNCGKTFYGKINSSQKICDECHKKLIKCSICGETNCQKEFCKSFSLKQIKALMRLFKIDKKILGTPEIEFEIYKGKQEIEKLYFNDHLPQYKIGEIFSMKSPNNMTKFFNFLKINKRNRRETSLNFTLFNFNFSIPILKSNNYQYKSGNHITWNNKTVFLRSSFEFDYAKKLDKLQIDYEVEKLRIKYFDNNSQLYRCAVPDFYIPSENLIVEIKSSWTLDLNEMKSKIKEYKKLGYKFKLIFNKEERNIEDIKEEELSKGNIKSMTNNKNSVGFYNWKWMNRNGIYKKIQESNVSDYLNLGWKLGRKGYTKYK